MKLRFEQLDAFCRTGIDDLVQEIPVIPGIREALYELRAAGAKIALITNSMNFVVERMLAVHGLTELFDKVSGADADSIDKVHRAQAVADSFDIEKEQMIYIGDTESDIQLARSMGCAACFSKTEISWYKDEAYIREILRPEYTFTQFCDLAHTIGVYCD